MAAEPKVKSTEVKPRAASDDVRVIPVAADDTANALKALMDEVIMDHDPAAAQAKKDADAAAEKQRLADEKAAADAKATETPEQIEAKRQADEKAAKDREEAQNKSDAHEPSLNDTIKAEEAERAEAQRLADEKAAAEAKAKEGDTAPKPDIFDSVALPTNAKSATTQSFNSLKELARKTAKELQAKVDAAAKLSEETATKLKELETAAASKAVASPELLSEVEDLRKFKIAHDATSDPEFAKFDAEITKQDERIYKKLAGHISDASIAKIKELGGLTGVDQEPILAALPVGNRRAVEAILVDIEGLKDQKADALTAAREKGAAYLAERATRDAQTAIASANGLMKDLPWTAEKAIPATATPEQKAELESHNAFAQQSVKTLKELLNTNRTPEAFAELAVCTVLAGKHKADLIATRAKLATVEAAHATATKDLADKLAAVTAERDAHAAKLLKIKQASLPRSAGANQTVTTTSQKTGIFDDRSASEALEALRLEAEAAQNA